MTTTNPLLYPLRIPWQIVVNNQTAELQVNPFGRGFCGNQNIGMGTEVVNDGGTGIHGTAACYPVCTFMLYKPVVINRFCSGGIVTSAEQGNTPGMPMSLKVRGKVFLSTNRFGEDYRFTLGPTFGHSGKTFIECTEK